MRLTREYIEERTSPYRIEIILQGRRVLGAAFKSYIQDVEDLRDPKGYAKAVALQIWEDFCLWK